MQLKQHLSIAGVIAICTVFQASAFFHARSHISTRTEGVSSTYFQRPTSWPTRAVVPMLLTTTSRLFQSTAAATTAEEATANDTPPKATKGEIFSNNFQIWALKRKRWWNPIAKIFLPLIAMKEKKKATIEGDTKGTYLHRKRLVLGNNFCCAGGVWLGDFDAIEKALLLPHARNAKVGTADLNLNRLPDLPAGGRSMFLLALSQQGAGGDGTYERIRRAVEELVAMSPEAYARQDDETSKKVLARLADHYKTYGQTDAFFTQSDIGVQDFLVRYLHYVLFGLDPFDEEKIAAISRLHWDSKSPVYFFSFYGKVAEFLKFKDWKEQFKAVTEIYRNTPVVANTPENEEKYGNLTRDEQAYNMVSMLALAALPGPYVIATHMMGHKKFWEYEGHSTHEIDVTKIWDELDLDNPHEVANYILECGRFRTPVCTTHRLVTEDETFTVNIRGKDHTFPPGTTVYVPLMFGGLDENVWGPTTYKFDHNREGLADKSMIFQSIGRRTNGRVCPGMDIATKMLSDMLVELGKVRRSPDFNPQGTAAETA